MSLLKLAKLSDKKLLSRLGYADARLLGQGGEGIVYKINENRILKLYHSKALRSDLDKYACLINEIHKARESVSFGTPYVHEIVEVDNRIGTIETFYPGEPLTKIIEEVKNSDEEKRLILGWLNAASDIGKIRLTQNYYGDLLSEPTEPHKGFHEYWIKRLTENLKTRGMLYNSVDVGSIVNSMPEPEFPAVVHVDLFYGNILWYEDKVSAVIDFGSTTILGDARLNALFAAVFIQSLTKLESDTNHKIVADWLIEHGLNDWLESSRKMLAAYWSFVTDVEALDDWCRSTFLQQG